jgi:hypothetical protein
MTEAVATKGTHGGKRAGAGRKPGASLSETRDLNEARARHEHWKAELAEQTFLKNAGELLPRAEVEQGNAMLFAKIAQTIRGWPDNLERVAGLTPEQAEALERMVDGLCLSLQDQVAAFGRGKKWALRNNLLNGRA